MGDWAYADTLDGFLSTPRPSLLPAAGTNTTAAQLGTSFHRKAGTLNPGVESNLTRIGNGEPAVRVSHQPNLAAYLKLFGLFIAADAVAAQTGDPVAYLINDCDTIGNERFRRAKLPTLTKRQGYEYVALPNGRESHETVAYRAAPPPAAWLDATIEKLARHLSAEGRLIRVPPHDEALSLETLAQDLDYARKAAGNLTEFTSIVLSRLVNLRLGLNVAFIPGHAIWQSVGAPVLTDLLARWDEVIAAQRSVANRLSGLPGLSFSWAWLLEEDLAPVWWLCDCDRRIRLRLEARNALELDGRCQVCDTEIRIERGAVTESLEAGRLIPRVGLLDLTEGSLPALACGVSYMSSGTHSLIYGLVGRELDIPPLQQVFLDPHGSFGTPVEVLMASPWRPKPAIGLVPGVELVQDGRASCFYYLTRISPDRLRDRIQTWMTTRQFDEPVCFR